MSGAREPLAIVGIGCRFPGADGPAAFWRLLVEGGDAVGEVPAERWDAGALFDPRPAVPGKANSMRGGFLPRVDGFDARWFGISPGEAAAMDPQQRLALEVAVEALEDAGITLEAVAGTATGVFMGAASADYAQLALADPAAVDMHTNAGAAAGAIANRVSYHLDLRGPSMVIDTACSASLVAVLTACRAIWAGECELALAGGVNVILSPALHVGFAQAQATSPSGRCAAFGAEADGMVRGEGVGVVVLKPLAQARRDGDPIYALVRGGAINQDGRTNGITAPNPAGQRALLAAACRDAGVAPGEVALLEAHGTGTPLGDPIEAAAAGAVFGVGRTQPLLLGSVKSNLGHLEAAAGVAGLIKVALALRHGLVPQTLHARAGNPRIDFAGLGLALAGATRSWPEGRRLAGVSAFGFAGTNCHVVLEGDDHAQAAAGPADDDARPTIRVAPGPFLVPVSARDERALRELGARWAGWLEGAPEGAAIDLAWTAAHRRSHQPVRRAVVASSREELCERLRDLAGVRAGRRRDVVFLYPGMGAQRPGMGRELLAEPAFREAIARVDAAIAPYLAEGELGAWSLLEALASDGADGRWERGDVAQPLQFALQVGLTALLRASGVRPAAVVGASLGEVAAAWASGALGLSDACRVVARRGRLMQTMAGRGSVAVLALPEAEAAAIAERAEGVWVAAANGPRQTLLSGERAALEAVIAEVEGQGGFARLVRGTLVASHSPVVEPLRESLAAALAELEPRVPELPMWSTVTGRRLDQPPGGAYWWENMRRPVRLADAIAAMAAQAGPSPRTPILVELAAHPALAPAVADVLAELERPADVVPALRRERPEPLAAREAIGALWAAGAEVDWAALVPTGGHAHLPTYPWRHERHWLAGGRAVTLVGRVPRAEAIGQDGEEARAGIAEGAAEAVGTRRSRLAALPLEARSAELRVALTRELGQLLDVAAVKLDPDAPLTALGVGSLVGMELNNRIRRELGVALPMALLLEGPSLARLAEAIAERLGPEEPPAVPPPTRVLARPEPLPASWAQRRMAFLERVAPGAAGYQVAGALRLRGPLDRAGLARTLAAIVARHEALRTSLPDGPDGPVQLVAAPGPVELPLLDLAASPAGEAEAVALAHLRAEAARPFELAAGPLMRACLIRLGADEHLLGVTLHHAVGDGWSLAVLVRELAALYPAGDPAALPPPALQYADWALWQRDVLDGPALARQLGWWRERLAGVPARLALPTDRPRPPVREGRGATEAVWVPPAAIAAADGLARASGATRFMVALAAFLAVLGRWSGQDDFCVGTPVSGRHQPDMEGAIGCFLNTLPIRADLAGEPSFGELVGRVRAAVLGAFANQDLPFERLVEALAPTRDPAWSPLFQAAFAWHAPLQVPQPAGLAAEAVEVDPGTARFDLAFGLHETDGGVRLIAEYDVALWDADTIRRLIAHFLAALTGGASAPETPIGALPAGEDEAGEDAGPLIEPPAGGVLAGLLAAPAGALAVDDGERAWRYDELRERAGRWAARLRELGVGPGVPVAIVAPRSAELVLAHVAVALAGGIAAPLDPAQPAPRLAAMAAELAAPVVMTLGPTTLPGLALDLAAEPPAASPAEPLADDAARAAYIVFTSGSTGRPRGVLVSAGALASLAAWHRAAYGLGPGDRVPLVASPGFDASLWEVWPALAAGATLLPAPDPAVTAPAAWPGWLAARGATLAFLPTPLAEAVIELPWPADTRLRALLTGGDRLRRRPPPGLPFRLFNHYGPSEAGVVATAGVVTTAAEAAGPGDSPPDIGRPIANVRVRVADAAGRPVPAGVPGELWIAGAGLAIGYWRDPAATVARFVELPGEGRYYRSGDRVRRRPDGCLEFLGRLDEQLSVGGVRVEPGELEAVLAGHPAVRACASAARDGALLAWVAGDAEPAALRAWLAERLPAALLPARLMVVEALPTTPAGKLDRRALPAPPVEELDEPPRDELEAAVAALWREVLGVERVGRETPFFALGGHSLLGWRLVGRVRERLGVELPLAAIFTAPTVAGMARAIAAAPAVSQPPLVPDPAGEHEPFPLTEVQAAYWVGRDPGLAGGGVAAHAYVELDVPGLDLARLQRVIDAMVASHPMLRAVVDADGRQRVLRETPAFPLEVTDLCELDPPTREAELAGRRAAWSHELRPADRWPLLAVRASKLPAGVVRLHLGLDALVADAASLGLLARELERRYREGDDQPRPPEIGFRDYVLALAAPARTAAVARAQDWWRARLPELPGAPELPTLGPPPSEPPTFTRRSGLLAAAAWARLRERAAASGVTPTAVLLAAFAEVLACWSRRPAFTLNLPTFRRLPLHPAVERLVGDFTGLVPLALDLAAEQGFAARAADVQARLWRALDHGEAGGVWIMREWARLRGEPVALPVVFTSVLDQGDLGLAPLGGELAFASTQTPQVTLDHQVMQLDGALVWHWDAQEAAFAPGLLDAMAAAWQATLERLAESDWAAALEPAGPDPAIAAANATGAPSAQGPLHAAFLARAAERPEAPAVVARDRVLSYGELLAEAEALAARLGDGPAALVLDRGWRPVVAVLAAAIAGVPWVPVDPAAPAERRARLIAAAGAATIIDAEGTRVAAAEVRGEGLAYVIYTSGSTGEPKGVAVSHAAAANTIADVNRRLGLGPDDRVLAVSQPGFDLAVWDVFGPLSVGAAVVVLEPDEAREPAAWCARMRAAGVTVWNSAPPLMAMLLAHAEARPADFPASLRVAMLSGDWIPLAMPERIRALAPACRVVSLGGATEAAIWSVWHDIDQPLPGWASVPYGRPLAAQTCRVLDDRGRERPLWAEGQLTIGGAGVAAGYWRDPARTAEAFVDGAYRTGDRARWRPTPAGPLLELLGREDDQVKVRGVRIELGEVEAVLREAPGVEAAAVVALGDRHARRLVGFVVGDAAAAEAWLARRLPEAMRPARLLVVGALPLTSSGKLDRRALAALADAGPAPAEPVAGATDPALVERLRAMAADALGLPDLDPRADLLALGVASLELVRLANRLEGALGARPAMAELLGMRTIEAVATWYASRPEPAAAADGLLLEPAAREAFKAGMPGLRRLVPAAPPVPLGDVDGGAERFASSRAFLPTGVSLAAYATLLAPLRAAVREGRPKLRYGSAGALYPVQLHLHVRRAGAGLPAGTYYHQPVAHTLVPIVADAPFPVEAHPFENRAVAEAAAFALYLVIDLAAITPLYGEAARDMALIEAGAIAQLLREAAPAAGLGLCAVGALDFARVAPALALGPSQVHALTLLGGALAEWEELTL